MCIRLKVAPISAAVLLIAIPGVRQCPFFCSDAPRVSEMTRHRAAARPRDELRPANRSPAFTRPKVHGALQNGIRYDTLWKPEAGCKNSWEKCPWLSDHGSSSNQMGHNSSQARCNNPPVCHRWLPQIRCFQLNHLRPAPRMKLLPLLTEAQTAAGIRSGLVSASKRTY